MLAKLEIICTRTIYKALSDQLVRPRIYCIRSCTTFFVPLTIIKEDWRSLQSGLLYNFLKINLNLISFFSGAPTIISPHYSSGLQSTRAIID